jgi:hypothetical protein
MYTSSTISSTRMFAACGSPFRDDSGPTGAYAYGYRGVPTGGTPPVDDEAPVSWEDGVMIDLTAGLHAEGASTGETGSSGATDQRREQATRCR